MPAATEALPYPDLLERGSGNSHQIDQALDESCDTSESEIPELLPVDYRIRVLGSLGSGEYESQARAINDYDQIAGYSAGHEQMETSVIIADIDSGITGLGNLSTCCAEAWDINNRGQVVGQLGLGQSQQAFNSSNGTIKELIFTGFEYIARAINDRGAIAGSLKLSENGERVGFILDSGIIRDIHGPDTSAPSTEVFDINNHGEAVGFTQTRFGRSAYRWTHEGGMRILPSMEGESVAYAINDAGVVAGWCRDTNANYCAVVWQGDSVLPCERYRKINSLFFGLNEKGEAVGMMVDKQTGRWRAAYWNGQRLFALPDQFGWMNWATDINNRGMICGTAFVPQISTFQASVWYRS